MDFARFNVESLAEVVEEGYDILCSCPTCSYMLRCVLGEKAFHESSIQLGGPLAAGIHELNPDRIVTDCLSCRLQFHQLLPYEVVHPVEVLLEACDGR